MEPRKTYNKRNPIQICCVSGCENNITDKKGSSDITGFPTLFRFPKNCLVKGLWRQKCSPFKAKWKNTQPYYVCKSHFKQSDLKSHAIHENNINQLRNNVQPYLNLPKPTEGPDISPSLAEYIREEVYKDLNRTDRTVDHPVQFEHLDLAQYDEDRLFEISAIRRKLGELAMAGSNLEILHDVATNTIRVKYVKIPVIKANIFSTKQIDARRRMPHLISELFACSVCDIAIQDLKALDEHRKMGHDTRIYFCRISLNSFLTEDAFKAHFRKCKCILGDDNVALRLRCKSCVKIFPNLESMEEHFTECEHDGALIVPFKLLNEFEADTSVQEAPIFSCKHCEKAYHFEEQLNAHLISFHPAKVICDICGVEMLESDSLHHKSKHDLEAERKKAREIEKLNAKYICQYCSKEYRNVFMCRAHEDVHRNNKNTMRKCRLCEVILEDDEKLEVHIIESHSTEQYYECVVCKRGFARRENLDGHVKLHDDSEIERFLFRRDRNRPRNIYKSGCPYYWTIKVGEAQYYQCKICYNTYNQERYVRRHQIIHLKNK